MKEMILLVAHSQFPKRNTFFNMRAPKRPPTPGEKDRQKYKRGGERRRKLRETKIERGKDKENRSRREIEGKGRESQK